MYTYYLNNYVLTSCISKLFPFYICLFLAYFLNDHLLSLVYFPHIIRFSKLYMFYLDYC